MGNVNKNNDLFWWIVCGLIIIAWNFYLYNQPPREYDVYDIIRMEQMVN